MVCVVGMPDWPVLWIDDIDSLVHCVSNGDTAVLHSSMMYVISQNGGTSIHEQSYCSITGLKLLSRNLLTDCRISTRSKVSKARHHLIIITDVPAKMCPCYVSPRAIDLKVYNDWIPFQWPLEKSRSYPFLTKLTRARYGFLFYRNISRVLCGMSNHQCFR